VDEGGLGSFGLSNALQADGADGTQLSVLLKTHYFTALEQRTGTKHPHTEKGQLSFTEEALLDIDDPLAKLYLKRLQLSSLIGGIKQRRELIGPDNRVHRDMTR
jgi:hypothetical protein